jgi:hypothetical protein
MYDIVGEPTGGGNPDWLAEQQPAGSSRHCATSARCWRHRDRQNHLRRAILQRRRSERAYRYTRELARPRPPARRLVTNFRHAGVEFIFMLTGKVRYRHADRTYVLEPGDALFFDAAARHGPEELIQAPMTYSIIIYPRRG